MRSCACSVLSAPSLGSDGPEKAELSWKNASAAKRRRGSGALGAFPFKVAHDVPRSAKVPRAGCPKASYARGREGRVSWLPDRLDSSTPSRGVLPRNGCGRKAHGLPAACRRNPRLQWRDRRGFSPRSAIPSLVRAMMAQSPRAVKGEEESEEDRIPGWNRIDRIKKERRYKTFLILLIL